MTTPHAQSAQHTDDSRARPTVSSIATDTLPRSMGKALNGSLESSSPVMNQTLSVINEHITDMQTPRHSSVSATMRRGHDASSEYSGREQRLSYIQGDETDEEEQLYTLQEVLGWSPQRVAEYLEDAGVEQQQCDVFKEQEISGEVLLGMDQQSVFLKEFDLGSVGRRLRTWQKIKALQNEVRGVPSTPRGGDFGDDDAASDPTRNRSTSVGTVLPRIPSLMESSSAGRRSPRTSVASGTQSVLGAPSEKAGSPRPSAADVRSLHHSRRHSSVDGTVGAARQGASGGSVDATPTGHKKQASFDRTWTMGGAKQPDRPSSASGPSPRPGAHGYSQSTDGTKFDSPQQTGMTAVTPVDFDRGYFSGGEVDSRKTRNLLRKKESPGHSRASSYTSETRKRSATHGARFGRAGSIESISDIVRPMMSPAAKHYYNTGYRKSNSRATSGPEFRRPYIATKDLPLSPTVTKLDYTDSPSIDAIAASPQVGGSDSSSIERPSPSSTLFPSRSRATGLRAISDAVTGGEKALMSPASDSHAPSPTALHSPARTGSSTPSGTSKSSDLDDAALIKAGATFPIPTLAPTLTKQSTARRKSKKSTSAYMRGLERKTPQEQIAGCDFSGWMKKRSSSLMTTWKPRLFVLRGRRLSYYYTENDTEEKGLIDISGHRVLPADNEKLTGLHATLTGATSTPTSPQNATMPTSTDLNGSEASIAAALASPKPDGPSGPNTPTSAKALPGDKPGTFIFKLVPPRAGSALSKGVTFTRPTLHYFAVDSIQIGRLWMAALMKATIDRVDEKLTTTYKEKTISLEKAMAKRERPPELADTVQEMDPQVPLLPPLPALPTEKETPKLELPAKEGNEDAAATAGGGEKEGTLKEKGSGLGLTFLASQVSTPELDEAEKAPLPGSASGTGSEHTG